jgi:hypothetical protein
LQTDKCRCTLRFMKFFFSPRFTPSYRYWRIVAASVE